MTREATMRALLTFVLMGLWITPAWAKTLRVPKGSIEPTQVHEELLAQFPQWQGTQKPNGIPGTG